MDLKQQVHDFWNEASCGEEMYLKGKTAREAFENQMHVRYQLEPYIIPFAGFNASKDKQVLEIGVGLGADHQMFAQNGALLSGCDLTERAIEYTRDRLQVFGLTSDLKVADAENLSYSSGQFDLVYSWGVIHHSPNTEVAVKEIYRVLKPGAEARIMIYNKHSMVGYMLWFRYALLRLRPFTSLKAIYSKYLESPGTKAYTPQEARAMFAAFSEVNIEVVLTHGDLLSSNAGQRHRGALLNIAKKIYPRSIIKALFPRKGLFMLISARK